MISELVLVLGASVTPDALPVAAAMSAGVRTALFGLLGLLLLILGCLIVFVLVMRRRPASGAPARPSSAGGRAGTLRSDDAVYPIDDPMACPACRREFDASLRYCPHDATELVSAPQMIERARHRKSYACLRCRRAYEGKVRYCPHDGTDLVPMGLYVSSRGGADHDGDCEGAKICPECRGRYQYAAMFCGRDGVELVVLN